MQFDTRPFLANLVFEIRYADGELYWDLSGRVRRSLRTADDRWDFAVSPDDGFWQCRRPLAEWKGLEETLLRLNFGALKADFGLEPHAWARTRDIPLDGLANLMLQATQCVLDGLSIERLIRLGLRTWQLFRLESMEDARRLLLATPYCRPEQRAPDVMGTPIAVSVVDRYELGGRTSRVAIDSAKITNKRLNENRWGILLDIDYFETVDPGQVPDLPTYLKDGFAYMESTATEVAHGLDHAAKGLK